MKEAHMVAAIVSWQLVLRDFADCLLRMLKVPM